MSMHQTNGRFWLSRAEVPDTEVESWVAAAVAAAEALGHTEIQHKLFPQHILRTIDGRIVKRGDPDGIATTTVSITAATDIAVIADDPLSEWDEKQLAELRNAGHRPQMVKALFVARGTAGAEVWWRNRDGMPDGRVGEIEGPFCEPECPACLDVILRAEDEERVNPAGGIFATEGGSNDPNARLAIREIVAYLSDKRLISRAAADGILRHLGNR